MDSTGNVGRAPVPKASTVSSMYRPFGIHWLDSALQETLLPDSPWHTLSEKISESWAEKLRKVMDHAEKRQMVFEIVGAEFVNKHFSDLPSEPMLLEMPQMLPHVRKHLRTDALSFMNHQLQKTVTELGVSNERSTPDKDKANSQTRGELSSELARFVEQTRESFRTGMDRHLLLGDKANEDMFVKKSEKPKQHRQPVASDKLDEDSTSVSGSSLAEKFETTTELAAKNKANQDKKFIEPKTGKPFTQTFPSKCWSPESEVLGLSVRALLERDPTRLANICQKLHGKFLPSTLRSFLWAEILFQKELNGPNLRSRRILRERLSRAITRGIVEMRLKKPTKTPINGLIENAVIEVYDKTSCMQAYNSIPQMREAVRVLNILYCYNRVYEPYLIYWLYPVQIAMSDHQHQDEHNLNLSLYLDMLVRSCYFKWPQISQMSQNVMRTLKSANQQFYSHLMDISTKDTEDLQAKDFIVDLLKIEESRAKNLRTTVRNGDEGGLDEEETQLRKEDLCNPVIFVRKWIGEGFVSVLDAQAVLLVWDQMMMRMWSESVAEQFSLALLFLLKESLEKASTYFEMKQVLLDFPRELHTRDILRAYVHLSKEGDPNEIPRLNEISDRYTPSATPASSPAASHQATPARQSQPPLRGVAPRGNAVTPNISEPDSETF